MHPPANVDFKDRRFGTVNPLNNLHSLPLDFMHLFKDISTKYSPGYLAWVVWVESLKSVGNRARMCDSIAIDDFDRNR